MADYEANFTLEPQTEIEADFSMSVINTEHNLLANRDLPDQHQISAITGLQDALDTIPTDYVSDAELEAALLEKQDVIHDLSEIRQGATLGATAVQPNDLESYATLDYVDNGLSGKQDTLTAGANIQIVGNTISATDTTYTAGTGISIVGNVISNTQTSAEWGNITGTLSAQTDLQNALNLKANTADLATVATTGNYSDLSGTPTIPTVNNATLTIQKNSTNVATFTANASSDVTANISVPTDTSDLTNSAGYITGVAWGNITGTLSNQTDLQSALDGKANDSNVVHKTGAETITGFKTFTNKAKITSSTAGAILELESGIANTNFLLKRTNGATCVLESGDTVGLFGTQSDHSLQIRTNYQTRMTFNTSGDVSLAKAPSSTSNSNQVATTAWTISKIPTNNNQLTNGAGYITSSALSGYQTTSNLVTSISSSSTDSQYPSAKLFYDTVGDIETAINTIRGV